MNIFFFVIYLNLLLFTRSDYLNLVLNALLNTTQQQQLQLDANGENLKLQVNEIYSLNAKVILEEFQVNPQLWYANENKLKELFTISYD